jgi:RNA polymerase primary sigma factor
VSGDADRLDEASEVVVESTQGRKTRPRLGLRKGRDLAADPAPKGGAARRPALLPARERQLVAAAAAGDAAAAAELIDAFLPSIAVVARHYRGAGKAERAELLQAGIVGLLCAARRFDPSRGSPFWAYATWWVRLAMQQLVSEVGRPAVLSDRAERRLVLLREARRAHVEAHGVEPSSGELAALVELSLEQVESLLAVEHAWQPLPVGAGDEFETGEVALVDPVAEEEYERVVARLEIAQIRNLTETLTGREREIVFQHYGLAGPPRTLREIGAALNISAERVRQIEEQALAKLRAAALEPPG